MPPRLVTPEAVVLDFETAGVGSRLIGALIDLAIQGLALSISSVALIALAAHSESAVAGIVVLTIAATAVLLGYPIAFETLWRGRTPGKAALGLRVVTEDGAPVRFRHAAVRGFLGLVDFYATSGAAAVLAVLLTRDNQRLGDLAAGTVVLRERRATRQTEPARFQVPAGYEGYAATLDVSGLDPEAYGAVRSFLLRAPTLAPDVRSALAAQVAAPIAQRLHHETPPGLGAEAFLACVAAARQRRYASAPGPGP